MRLLVILAGIHLHGLGGMRHLFGLTCFVCAILCGVFFAGFTEVMQVVTTNPLFFWLAYKS